MSDPIGPAEMLERRQKQRQSLILCLLMVAGGVTGLVFALTQQDGTSLYQGAIPAWAAIALALFCLVSVVGGSFWLKRHIDEIETAAQIWGIATGGTVVIVLYPIWYLLWRGQMIFEPNAHIMFGALYGVMVAAYLWKKFR